MTGEGLFLDSKSDGLVLCVAGMYLVGLICCFGGSYGVYFTRNGRCSKVGVVDGTSGVLVIVVVLVNNFVDELYTDVLLVVLVECINGGILADLITQE